MNFGSGYRNCFFKQFYIDIIFCYQPENKKQPPVQQLSTHIQFVIVFAIPSFGW